jgi:hypothetical protein
MPKFTFNPFTGNFDAYENNFGTEGIYLTDPDGVQWQLTVDTAGVLVTTAVAAAATNNLLLEDAFSLLLEDGNKLQLE